MTTEKSTFTPNVDQAAYWVNGVYWGLAYTGAITVPETGVLDCPMYQAICERIFPHCSDWAERLAKVTPYEYTLLPN